MMQQNTCIWYDLTEDLAIEKPLTAIDINERVIAYGDGFFSTMAVVNGKINWLNYHQKRCEISASHLKLTLNLTAVVNRLCDVANQIQQGVLKLIVCRQNQSVHGYGFSNSHVHVWLKVMPSDTPIGKNDQVLTIQPPAFGCCLLQQIPVLPPNLAGLKLLNTQAQVLACAELMTYQQHQPNLIDGLVKDAFGNWIEGTFCNVFYQLNDDNQWFTPPVNRSGVNGVMRQVLMDKCCQNQQAVQERFLQDVDFKDLSALFFCNAVRGVIPIERLYFKHDLMGESLGDALVLQPRLPTFNQKAIPTKKPIKPNLTKI
ncbi:branched-chain amino acid aminotransferase/4-amino-4-deoxychorismate lyase-like protein [Moraxella macacae 0408225]|uniref:Branched-chain amino acid aminotransferase/4-amino-4-deoxychorismate lyase-like protein n=1 Tax=Moraxella macacae 0408225 TaxID=1230338 RepID=L2F7K2_9GAMM|nr:aminotransferase class IV [Moraxella macacae]ELA09007.1 branched-chain amino acid aminotransferase/4-amino-4-deoxychorismate lyase-like protein [Moraxella macacae 0408225]